MKVVVTGGAGFIGANLCRALAADLGHRRRRPRRPLDGIARPISTVRRSRVRSLVEGRSSTPALLDEVLAGAEAVVHLAARPSVPRSLADPMASHLTNATGHHGGARGGPASGRPAGGGGLVLVGLRGQPGAAQARGHGDHAGQPLRGQQARRRGRHPRPRPVLRPARARLPLLQRLRAAAGRRPRLRRRRAGLRLGRPARTAAAGPR